MRLELFEERNELLDGRILRRRGASGGLEEGVRGG